MLEEHLASIEASETIDDLVRRLQAAIEGHGFASFQFLDVGHPELDKPFHIGTTGQRWEDDYKGNGFVHVDPVIPVVRRANLPFSWGDVPPPMPHGRNRSGALRTLDAAKDHGFNEGLVVPFHFSDTIGRINSASCVFFWKDDASRFRKVIQSTRHELHLLALYSAHRMIELSSAEFKRRNRFPGPADAGSLRAALSDRERETLTWSARGKTMSEIADILTISGDTVESHVRNALRKLEANNKTHAVAKAIFLGLIDI
jgi:LuxR family transcriptional regulator, quorum-sensing system regulator BjaR1